MVELYVVRHGETSTNSELRINGAITDKPLNDKGIHQAKELRDIINISKFDEVYTSPLQRTLKTAEILNQDQRVIKKDSRLVETNYGSWDGIKLEPAKKEHPDAIDEHNLVTDKYTKYAKDGETYDHVYQRIADFMTDMAKKNDEKILIICHGFVQRAFFKVVTKIPNVANVLQPDNLGVSKYITDEDGNYNLVYYSRVNNID